MSNLGKKYGGKISTPIREMMANKNIDGVIFHCEDPEHAESVRISALTAKTRDKFDFHTTRMGDNLIVYACKDKDQVIDLRNGIHVNLCRKA